MSCQTAASDHQPTETVPIADTTASLLLFEHSTPQQQQQQSTAELTALLTSETVAEHQQQWQTAAGLTQLEIAVPPIVEQQPQQQEQPNILPCCICCGKPITDEYILRVLGEAWHAACLRCSDCGEQLQERCFILSPLPDLASEMPPPLLPPLLCRRDFLKRSAARCPRCNQVLGEGELVRKAQDFTFHAHCFACVACQRELITGQLFYVLADSTLLCKFHYETAKERQNRILAEGAAAVAAASPSEAAAFFAMSSSMSGQGGWGDAALQLLRGPVGLGALCGAGGGLGGGHSSSVNGPDGPKRPRTTINSLQLELLRRAYETSSKPPRHVREQLSQETGLDMRVVQVWFQNKRAKEKRMRKDPSSVASNSGAGGNSLSIFGHGNGDGSSTSSANFGRRRHRGDDDDDSDNSDSLHSFDDDAPDDYVDD